MPAAVMSGTEPCGGWTRSPDMGLTCPKCKPGYDDRRREDDRYRDDRSGYDDRRDGGSYKPRKKKSSFLSDLFEG